MGCTEENSNNYGPVIFAKNNIDEEKIGNIIKKKKVIYKKPVRYNFRITEHNISPRNFINLNSKDKNESEMEISNNFDIMQYEEKKTEEYSLKQKKTSIIQNNNNNNNNYILKNSLNLIFPLENQPKYNSNNNYDEQKLITDIINNSSNNEFPQYNFEENNFNNNNVIENNPINTSNRSFIRRIYPSYEPPFEINNNISNTPRYHDLNNFQYNNNFQNQGYDDPLFHSFQNPNFEFINTNPYDEIINLPLRHSISDLMNFETELILFLTSGVTIF